VALDDLYDFAVDYRDVCLTALAETAAGKPDCVYLSPGPPLLDIDVLSTNGCLTVHVGPPTIADTLPLQPAMAPLHRIVSQGEVNLVPFTATIARPSPQVDESGIIYDADASNRVSKQVYSDLWAIWNHVRAAKNAGLLFPPQQREMELQPALPIPQQGGVCGWQITVRVNVYGYAPAGIDAP